MQSFTEEELKNYLIYLNFIQQKLDKYFEAQKPFIFCKKGCGKCCKKQQFPYTQIEMQYLITGVLTLSPDIRDKVEENLNKVIEEHKIHIKKKRKSKFVYDCPFLIDNVCCVYEYRGLICRSFGLMIKPKEGKISVPFCFFDGLNYSNVMNKRTKMISERKCKKLNVKETPNAYQVGYYQLADEDLAKGFGFKFSEVKPMINWFEEFKENM